MMGQWQSDFRPACLRGVVSWCSGRRNPNIRGRRGSRTGIDPKHRNKQTIHEYCRPGHRSTCKSIYWISTLPRSAPWQAAACEEL